MVPQPQDPCIEMGTKKTRLLTRTGIDSIGDSPVLVMSHRLCRFKGADFTSFLQSARGLGAQLLVARNTSHLFLSLGHLVTQGAQLCLPLVCTCSHDQKRVGYVVGTPPAMQNLKLRVGNLCWECES